MERILIFILGSAGIAWISREGLRKPRTYVFYRFFAFEVLLVMVLANAPGWFADPLSITQMISWGLLFLSLLLALYGFDLLISAGRPLRKRSVDTSLLVRQGAYRYIRHPLYGSLLVFALGVFFKIPSLLDLFTLLLFVGFLTITARQEEQENLRKFGDDYRDYMRKTKMFIPFLF